MRRPRELDPSLLLDRRGRALRVAAALSLGVALAPLPASAQQVDAAPGPSPTPSAAPKQEAPSAPDPVPETPKPTPASLAAPEPPKPPSGFGFGSYGRVIAATDFRGRPGRNADIVARGSRLDEGNYMEIELNRSDYWAKTDSCTRIVATLAITNPIFHYSGDFNVKMAVRNLFIESYDLGLKGMSVWAGSRMYRGDDIYLLDFWPLDNLNTLGGGARYDILKNTFLALQFGVSQPFSGFYVQDTSRPNVYNQLGAATVRVLDRQRFVGSAKASHIFPIGEGGIKVVAYGEGHFLPQGQREERAGVFETLPSDDGYVIGGQISAYTGQRSTHLNIYGRYARGLAAYGDPVSTPSSLAADETTRGAHEFLFAVGGNWEIGPFGLLFGSYYRIFRNASPSLDFNDLNEGIVALRPQVFFGEIGGLAVEGSYQAQQRGAIAAQSTVDDGQQASGPARGSLWRFGVIPFLSPAGRGSFSRPQLRLIYVMALRDQGARSLYPQDDVYSLRQIEHFFGFGAEWWFNSSSYSR